MKLRSGMLRYGLAIATLSLMWGLLLDMRSISLASPVEQASQRPPAWYTVADGFGAMQSIGVSSTGTGWVAMEDARPPGSTRMYRLQDTRLTRTDTLLSETLVHRIAVSKDGQRGWAVGEGGSPSHGAIVELAAGKWIELPEGVVRGLPALTGLALDASARNGWAVGVHTEVRASELLRLADGTWTNASDTIPKGVLFNRIAADPALKHIWASGFDAKGDAALYYLKGNTWTSVSKPIGHYVIFDIAVDSQGQGWAGLDTNDEPANSPSPTGFVRFKPDGTWNLVATEALSISSELSFRALRLDEAGNGWAIGNRLGVGSGPPPSVLLRLEGNTIVGQQYPTAREVAGLPHQQPVFAQPSDLGAGAAGMAWAVTFDGVLLRYGDLPPGGAIPQAAPGLPGEERCLRQNAHCMRGAFLKFWSGNGGLDRFGLPLTGEIYERLGDGKIYQVQYMERARFEYHPENKDPKHQVLLGLLGNMLAQGRENEPPFKRAAETSPNYFPQTGHNLTPPLLGYWTNNGGLPVFGYPISEAFNEKSPTDGKTYLVQYFERNRLEYHPENKDPKYQVLLGLLGVQQYERTYGRKP